MNKLIKVYNFKLFEQILRYISNTIDMIDIFLYAMFMAGSILIKITFSSDSVISNICCKSYS